MPRARIIALGAAVFLAVHMSQAVAETPAQLLDFADLDGWAEDDHAAALDVFRVTCGDMRGPDWQGLCALAATAPNARTFFELFFRPVLIGGDHVALFTGYFEPELDGSRVRTPRYRYPIYRVPPELAEGQQWLSRAEIETSGVLEGRGLEIAWVDDAVELFFLQIQGSGRIRLRDGTVIRVGYGARNGHEYRSIGHETGPARHLPVASGFGSRHRATGCAATRPRGGSFCTTTRPTSFSARSISRTPRSGRSAR
jgi:membrane-bound lytic murein transglycosylase A